MDIPFDVSNCIIHGKMILSMDDVEILDNTIRIGEHHILKTVELEEHIKSFLSGLPF